VRSNSDVQFITVSPISQISLLIIGLIELCWMAYASINIVFKDQVLELKQQKLFEVRLDYENRLPGLRASVERTNDRMLLDQKSYLRKPSLMIWGNIRKRWRISSGKAGSH
jgi:hypothetical protein